MSMEWEGIKPGKFVNQSTLVPINDDNLNAVVDTIQKIATGEDNIGLNATTLQGVYKEGFSTTDDVGLINYYSFDSFDTKLLLDDSINGKHAAPYSVSLIGGIIGGGGSFNGTSSYIKGSCISVTEHSFSIWYKGTDSGNDKRLCTIFNSNLSYKSGLFIHEGKAEFRIRTTSGTITKVVGPNINDNKWHHIVGTFNGENISIYADGILIQSVAASLIASYFDEFRICASEEAIPTIYTSGSIDEFRIYNKALSLNNITSLYLTKNGSKSVVMSQSNIPYSIPIRSPDGSLNISTIELLEDGVGPNNLKLLNNSGLTQNRTLTFNTNDANRTLSLKGNLTLDGSLTTIGSFSTILRTTANTDITLPVSGLLAKVDSETFIGIPKAPTAPTGTANTQLATTAFVNMEAIKYALVMG